jgi:gas vesicle protein
MKDTKRILAALLIGAAAGAALGLLLAPEKGETVREGIADFVNDLIDAAKNKAQAATGNLKDIGNTAYDRAKSKFRGAVNEADEAINNAKSKVESLKDEAKSHFGGAKSKVKSAADDLNDSIQDA